MGANLCCIGRSCVGGPAPESGHGLKFAAGNAICEWRRQQWKRMREKTEVKREKEASIEKKKKQYMSLEELMLASPGASSERGFGGGGGEFNVSNRGGFKRKVHPARIANASLICERSMMNELIAEDEYSGGDFSISSKMMTRKKKKKKVSFRLPEVSDVIVIYSPEDDGSADDVNVKT